MISLDTNVLARYFVEEEDADAATQAQRQAARQLIESGQDLLLPKTVAPELEWPWNWSGCCAAIAASRPSRCCWCSSSCCTTPACSWKIAPSLEQAVAGLRSGLDFADALDHASCRDCEAIASFDDRGFARRIRQLNLPPRVVIPTAPSSGSDEGRCPDQCSAFFPSASNCCSFLVICQSPRPNRG